MTTSYLTLGALPKEEVSQVLFTAVSSAINGMSDEQLSSMMKAPAAELQVEQRFALAA
jgi:hypothetical protein